MEKEMEGGLGRQIGKENRGLRVLALRDYHAHGDCIWTTMKVNSFTPC